MSDPSPIKVLMVDDHPVVRLGLRSLLQQEGIQVSAEAATVEAALQCAAQALPDLVVTDLALNGEDGLELIRRLAQAHPGLRVLVYSTFEDGLHISRALAAGATAYVTKGEPFECLARAIREGVAGRPFLSEACQQAWRDAVHGEKGLGRLSLQEIQVYGLLGLGFSVSAIAARLDVSPRTVESYFARIQDKLGFRGMKRLRLEASSRPV